MFVRLKSVLLSFVNDVAPDSTNRIGMEEAAMQGMDESCEYLLSLNDADAVLPVVLGEIAVIDCGCLV